MSVPFRTYGDGELLDSEDLDQDNNATRDLIGAALQVILSATNGNALPSSNGGPTPLNVVPGSGLQVVIGGTGQTVLLNGRVVTNCQQQTFTVPANSSGSPRVDMIAVQQAYPTTAPQTPRPIENPDTSINPSGTVYSVLEGITYEYFAGTTTPPAGFADFVQITVASGASVIHTGDIALQFPTTASLIEALISSIAVLAISGNLTVGGTTGLAGALTGSAATFTGAMTADHFVATAIAGLLLAHGASVQSDVNGALYLNAHAGQDIFAGDIHTGAITVGGSATVVAGLGVGGNTVLTGTLGVTGDSTLGNLDVEGTFNVDGTSTFVGDVTTTADVNVGGNASVTGVLEAVGTYFSQQLRITNTQTQSVTIDGPLLPGNWRVRAHANFNMNGSQTVTMTGSSGTWETPSSTNDSDQPNNADLYLLGTAVGGQQPSVSLASSIASPYTGYLGILEIEMWRIS